MGQGGFIHAGVTQRAAGRDDGQLVLLAHELSRLWRFQPGRHIKAIIVFAIRSQDNPAEAGRDYWLFVSVLRRSVHIL